MLQCSDKEITWSQHRVPPKKWINKMLYDFVAGESSICYCCTCWKRSHKSPLTNQNTFSKYWRQNIFIDYNILLFSWKISFQKFTFSWIYDTLQTLLSFWPLLSLTLTKLPNSPYSRRYVSSPSTDLQVQRTVEVRTCVLRVWYRAQEHHGL